MLPKNVPDWLDEKFFEKVLRKSTGDKNLTILDVNVAASVSTGEQYASSVFKATIKYSSSKFPSNDVLTKLFVKLVVPKVNAFTDENTFETELNMYTQTLPDMQRLLSQSGETIEFAPKLLYSAKEPVSVLVFEDMTMHGYGLSSGTLNLDGTMFVAAKLAKFHATSFYMGNDGKGVDYYSNGLFNLKSRDGIYFMKHNMNLCMEEMKSWDGFETIVEKMEILASKFVTFGEKVYTPNSPYEGYNVLNHGDFHFNNMVFKTDANGELSDVVFLDFQLTKWGSPCIDIFYLLHMVASPETRDEHREKIISHYYDEFIKTLKAIGYMSKPPALLELNIELLKNGFLEIVIVTCFLPFFFVDHHTQDISVAFENGVEGVNLRRELYKNPKLKVIMQKFLNDAFYKGMLH